MGAGSQPYWGLEKSELLGFFEGGFRFFSGEHLHGLVLFFGDGKDEDAAFFGKQGEDTAGESFRGFVVGDTAFVHAELELGHALFQEVFSENRVGSSMDFGFHGKIKKAHGPHSAEGAPGLFELAQGSFPSRAVDAAVGIGSGLA
jgi:hypothetical protein